ncbi:MAG TPA: cation diffusion facilitator family transporter [Lacipirellulaceae bacterium]|nr:cation diffusion facilitator family transporter [Lacipirellulaceae bacterium]
MPHSHPHVDEYASDQRLLMALGLNLLLTIVETIAGILAGSLALVADAVHNLSDCGSFVIALVARRIGRWPSDELRTFGYRRAEIIGALVNLTILMVISLYLIYEAAVRFFSPRPVHGGAVVTVATIALVINLATTALLFTMSRHDLNVRAAYLHNLGDAFSSLGVIVAGIVILWFHAVWFDSVITLIVAAVIIWQSLPDIRRSIHILMEGAPTDVETSALVTELQSVPGVAEIHHLHLWELDEHHRALEAHIVVEPEQLNRWTDIKQQLKLRLGEQFDIHHSTLEFEALDEDACQPCRQGEQRHC